MSDAQNEQEPEPGGVTPAEVVETTEAEVTVRRSPRYLSFILVGLALGAIAALVLTLVFPENAEFDQGQVFGFLLLVCGTIGVALACVVALLLDRAMSKRARSVVAEHESTHRDADGAEPA